MRALHSPRRSHCFFRNKNSPRAFTRPPLSHPAHKLTRARTSDRTVSLANACASVRELFCKVATLSATIPNSPNDVNLFPGVTIYPRTEIGQRVRIHANTVIGSDGFGYVQDRGIHRKVPQIGNVVIGDDVEIGAGVTVDRGALGPTVIGKGTKIDNLVQIAHNVEIGEGSLIIAQVGISGSSKLGKYVVLAGQVGIAGHLKIGNQVTVAAKAGVMSDIPDGEKWLGAPAQPDKQAKRQVIAIQLLPELLKRVAALEKQLGLKQKRDKSKP